MNGLMSSEDSARDERIRLASRDSELDWLIEKLAAKYGLEPAAN